MSHLIEKQKRNKIKGGRVQKNLFRDRRRREKVQKYDREPKSKIRSKRG
jgi:hypothetical protein